MDHSTLALLLIALGVGAIVKYKAIKATKCQTGGKILGYVIMVLATLGLICSTVCAYKTKGCHDEKAKKECHDCDDAKELPPGHPDISTMSAPTQPSK